MNTIDPAEHLSLAKKMAWKYKKFTDLEYDDVLSICYLAMIKAAEKYDPEKGAWSTIASKYMYYAILRERDRRKSVQDAVSLESFNMSNSDGQATSWQELMPDLTESNTEDYILDKMLAKDVLANVSKFLPAKRISERHRQAIAIYVQNPEMSQQKIADIIGVSQATVNRYILKFRERVREQLAI